MAAVREHVKTVGERILIRLGFEDVIATPRGRRFVGYGVVGATGIPVDMLATNTAAGAGIGWLWATLTGYFIAMTYNFGMQRRYVFAAEGNLIRQYLRYLGVDAAAATVRTLLVGLLLWGLTPEIAFLATRTGRIIPLLTQHSIAPVTVATLIGIVASFLVAFFFTDTWVFNGGDRL